MKVTITVTYAITEEVEIPDDITVDVEYTITKEVEIPDGKESKELKQILINEAYKLAEAIDTSKLEWMGAWAIDENGKELANW